MGHQIMKKLFKIHRERLQKTTDVIKKDCKSLFLKIWEGGKGISVGDFCFALFQCAQNNLQMITPFM
jgi:hypothetical protein